jgi:hypothetical protein
MGANAVTTVPVYTAGEVLTAADLNITNSGIPVFASTVERDAAFGGTGEKTLAEGQYAFLEDSNSTQFYDGASWQSVGVSPGIVLVKSQTIGTTVSSVEVTGAFSSTYDNYKIVINGGVGSTDIDLSFQLGATTTGYYSTTLYGSFNGVQFANEDSSNAASLLYVGSADTGMITANFDVISPNLAKKTVLNGAWTRTTTTGSSGTTNGFLNNTTQYTAFTIIPSTGTLTGGTIRVYGYANS